MLSNSLVPVLTFFFFPFLFSIQIIRSHTSGPPQSKILISGTGSTVAVDTTPLGVSSPGLSVTIDAMGFHGVTIMVGGGASLGISSVGSSVAVDGVSLGVSSLGSSVAVDVASLGVSSLGSPLAESVLGAVIGTVVSACFFFVK